MRRPWEVTLEEVRAKSEKLRERRRAAHREAAPMLTRQLAELDADDGFAGFTERHDLFMADHPDYEAQVAEDFRLIAEIRERQDIPEGDPTTED